MYASIHASARQCIIFDITHTLLHMLFERLCICVYDDYGDLVEVTIPATHTSLPSRGLFYRRKLRRVTIFAQVDTLPAYFLRGCVSLTELVLPNTLRIIEASALQQCVALTTLDIPEGVEEIHDLALADTGLMTLNLPHTVSVMGHSCLANSQDLQCLTLSNSLIDIPTMMLYGCTSLHTLTINTNAQLRTIGSMALAYTSISSLMIPTSVRKIDEYALKHSIIQSLTINSRDIKLQHEALAHCSKLKTLVLPDICISISPSAFAFSTGVHNTLEENGYDTDGVIQGSTQLDVIEANRDTLEYIRSRYLDAIR